MKSLGYKKFISDLESKKVTWKGMGVPEHIINKGLAKMRYDIPSQIQAQAVQKILENENQNYLFQASNGGGKTGAFGVPAIIRVDPKNPATQVLIFGNSRELIRQT